MPEGGTSEALIELAKVLGTVLGAGATGAAAAYQAVRRWSAHAPESAAKRSELDEVRTAVSDVARAMERFIDHSTENQALTLASLRSIAGQLQRIIERQVAADVRHESLSDSLQDLTITVRSKDTPAVQYRHYQRQDPTPWPPLEIAGEMRPKPPPKVPRVKPLRRMHRRDDQRTVRFPSTDERETPVQ